MDYSLECYLCHKSYDPFEVNFSDMVLDGEYRPVCETCFHEHYFKCGHCSEDKPVESKVVHNGKTYCRDCFNQLFVICSECGEVVRRGEARSSGSNFLCQECYRQGEILSNGYKPEPKFKRAKEETHDRFLGVELEIDGGDNPVSTSKKVYKLANKESYNKHDGSLRNGFEIVTHPMTLKYHKENFPWKEIMSTATKDGFKSHSTRTCGLHVHLSRKAFGVGPENDFNTMKMVMFFENNWDNLVTFSRRRPEALNSWAKRFGVYSDVKNQKDWEYHYKSAKGCGDRYHAVNLTNRNTVEIRIFRGTLVPSTLYAALELLDLLMQKLPRLSFEETLRYDFKAVIRDAEQLSFHNLIEYCKSRRIPNDAKYQTRIPKVGETIEICGRVIDFPINSGRANGVRGIVTRIRACPEEELEHGHGGILAKFDFGEYWVRPSSVRIVDPTQVEQEETVERKVG